MDTFEFTKGHGTGNDFVIVPDPDGLLSLDADLVVALCDRHFGVGADGVLRVVRTAAVPQVAAAADAAEWFMDYRNADGSVAEMCGNGVRVFARYLVQEGFAKAGEIPLLTRAGRVVAVVAPEAVTVDMGAPRVYGTGVARIDGMDLDGVAVDCGNPHLVCPVPTAADLDALDLAVPPEVDDALFPAGVNVEFTTPVRDPQDGGRPEADAHVRMRVHERGSGETLSCGSGACAVAAVTLRGLGREQGVVAVDVSGGRLIVTLTDATCWLAGPAVLVARGTVEVPALARVRT